MSRRHKSPRQKTPRKPRPPDLPATHHTTAAGIASIASTASQSRGIPAVGSHVIATGASALDLAAPAIAPGLGLADTILDIVGAQHATLRATLTAWQREQDRVANRAWRRPGGLARPANL